MSSYVKDICQKIFFESGFPSFKKDFQSYDYHHNNH